MDLGSRKIVVTGGSGYLGTHVRRYFGADDMSRRTGIDICKEADARCINDYDIVIHMAAVVDKRPDMAMRAFSVNVGGTIKVLENLRSDQTFIYCSTKDVYGQHVDQYQEVPESCSTEYCGQGAYEWSKLIAEKYVQYYGARVGAQVGIFRLSTVYGPATEGNPGGFVSYFARAVAQGETLRLKMNGEQRRDLLHVNDLARAFEFFIHSKVRYGCYNIGGGPANTVTLYQLTQVLAKLAGRAAELVVTDEPVKEQVHYVSDIKALEREIGWQPQLGVEAGLKTLLPERD
jgi:CDP-paratose 2-epimerase